MSEKTTAEKLQIKPGYAVYLEGHPGAAQLLGTLPADAVVVDTPEGADAALVFFADSAGLRARLDAVLESLVDAAAVWICYPKGNAADLNRDSIRERVDGSTPWNLVSNVSIDGTWSALRARLTR